MASAISKRSREGCGIGNVSDGIDVALWFSSRSKRRSILSTAANSEARSEERVSDSTNLEILSARLDCGLFFTALRFFKDLFVNVVRKDLLHQLRLCEDAFSVVRLNDVEPFFLDRRDPGGG